MSEEAEEVVAPVEAVAEPATPETPPEVAPEPEIDVEEDANAKRIARLAHEAREAKRAARLLKAENETLRGQRQEQPDEELDRKVTERATALAHEREFTAKCNDVYSQGVKTFGKSEFDTTVQIVNETLGALPPQLIEAALEAGDAHKTLKHLADNTDILEEIAGMPPHRMGAAIAKLAVKLATPTTKAVSKAPAPIRPVLGNAKAEVDIDKMPLNEYMKYMDEHDAKRRWH